MYRWTQTFLHIIFFYSKRDRTRACVVLAWTLSCNCFQLAKEGVGGGDEATDFNLVKNQSRGHANVAQLPSVSCAQKQTENAQIRHLQYIAKAETCSHRLALQRNTNALSTRMVINYIVYGRPPYSQWTRHSIVWYFSGEIQYCVVREWKIPDYIGVLKYYGLRSNFVHGVCKVQLSSNIIAESFEHYVWECLTMMNGDRWC